MRSLVLLVLLACLACAPTAHGASRLVIRGAGFGHGIGMSQYGAYGLSLQGVSYRDILARYYTGTTLAKLDATPDVRVLLQGSRRTLRVRGVVAAGDRELDPDTTYTVTRGGDGLLLRDGDRELLTSAPPMRLAAPGEEAFVLGGVSVPGVRDGRYRGALEVRPGSGGGVNAINALDLETYVRGVVSAESPSAWPAEQLKAQAIAARTYAITSRAGSLSDGFDQYADVRSQVYRGVDAERPSTDAAVSATRSEVVTFAGKPVTTFFFSTSGGHTESVENSFVGSAPRPWLKGVKDPYDNLSPKHRWGPIRMTDRQATARLRGLVRGRFKSIKVLRRGASPRIVYAEVVGTGGRTRVTGPQLRRAFGLFDTWAYFTTVTTAVRKPKAPAPPAIVPPSTTDPAPGGGGVAPPAQVRAAAVGRSVIAGTITPARRGAWVALQRRVGGRWVTAVSALVRDGGRYAVRAPGAGVYRVRYGDGVVGPDVRVR